MAEASKSVQSVDRVFDILEALSLYPTGISLSELSNAVNLNISTTHRLLNTLAARGYVRKDITSGKYRMTLRLFEISSRCSHALNLLAISKNLLEYLANSVKETVHLVERDGCDVVYLYKFEPLQHMVNMASVVGCRNPMYCTGVGKSIMALMPELELQKVWQQMQIEQFTPNTIVNYEQMKQELMLTRNRGYALDNEEHELGVCCIAIAIRNWEGNPIGAVSISAPTARMTRQRVEDLRIELQHICDEICKMLGYVS